MRVSEIGDPTVRLKVSIVKEHPVTFLRCPKCLGHLDRSPGPNHRGQEDLFWECPVCALHLKIWAYYPGDD